MSCDLPDPEESRSAQREIDLPEGVPPLGSLYLYMTNGCNLRCRHCWINPPYVQNSPASGEFIDSELLKDAVISAKTLGLSHAKLTGGEPFLHPQFVDIVDFLYSQEISVNMETNGTLITRDLACYLKENSRVWHISVSLDSPRPEYHDRFRGVSGAFVKTVQGIKHLVSAGYRPQIIMCPHPENIHEIKEMVELAINLGAGSVKFNPINGIGRGKSLQEKGDVLDFDELLSLVSYIKNDLQALSSIPLIALLPPALIPLRELLDQGRFCGTCRVLNILGILGSGEMALCGIGRTVPDLCFGRLGQDNLRDVWINNHQLNQLRKGLAGELPGICGDCIHSSRCVMNCIALNYAENGELISPDPICLEAERRGVFPLSRRRVTKN